MNADVVVIGGGPAGAAAAADLAGAGRRVIVIERSREPQQSVCGEFLSGPTIQLMARLGLGADRLGALAIERMRLVHGDRVAEAALPFLGGSLPRDRLDRELLDVARQRGALVLRGRPATRLEQLPGGVRAQCGGQSITASAAVLATGKHELRGRARISADKKRQMLGFKQYWRLAAAQDRRIQGHVEVHLVPGGYAGLQPSPGGRANLCVAVSPWLYDAAGRSWPALLARLCDASPLLAERLTGASPDWPRPLAVAALPYGFVVRGAGHGSIHPVGDQLAVIHSFCGEGIAIALDSGRTAAQRILAGQPSATGGRYRRQVAAAQVAARLLALPAVPAALTALFGQAPALLGWFAGQTRVNGR